MTSQNEWDHVADEVLEEVRSLLPSTTLQRASAYLFGTYVFSDPVRMRRYELSYDERLLLVHEFVVTLMSQIKRPPL